MTDKEFRERLDAIRERALSKTLGDDNEESYTESLFESIRHANEYGQEFWHARELQVALEYKEWRNFSKVVEKAKTACEGSENNVSDHFVDVNKIVKAGATHKKIGDIALSRYACYLIVQNAAPPQKGWRIGWISSDWRIRRKKKPLELLNCLWYSLDRKRRPLVTGAP